MKSIKAFSHVMGLITVLTVAFAALLALVITSPVFASRGEVSNLAELKQERQDRIAYTQLVRIEGSLTCDPGAENSGQSCELKLQENGSHRTYNLIEASAAMRLYQDGKKNVAIEGRLEGTDTLQVKTAQTL